VLTTEEKQDPLLEQENERGGDGEEQQMYRILMRGDYLRGGGHTVSMYSPLGAAFRAAGRDILAINAVLFFAVTAFPLELDTERAIWMVKRPWL
jgi:hypothetical protein